MSPFIFPITEKASDMSRKFALVFPSGLSDNGNNIILSYGDYDSFAKTLSFDKKELEGCFFDVPYLKCPKKLTTNWEKDILLNMNNTNLKKFKNIVEYPITFPNIPKIDDLSSININSVYSNCFSLLDKETGKDFKPSDIDRKNWPDVYINANKDFSDQFKNLSWPPERVN